MPRYDEVDYIGPPKSYSGKYSKLFIVLHSTEGTADADNEAGYAKRRTDGVSSHYYVDGSKVVQSLNTDYSAHHVGSTAGNRHGISWEFCGRASWSRATWLDRIDWDAAAEQMARDCRTWGIPVRRLTVDQLRDLDPGVTTHNDCRRAFGGTTHTDPGDGFPMDHLLTLVSAYLNGDDDVTPEELMTADVLPNREWRGDFATNPKVRYEFGIGSMWDGIHRTEEDVSAIKAEQAAAKARDVAILAAVQGVNEEAILAKIDALASAESQRAEAAAARDAALLAEVQGMVSGGATADQIVDVLAARLAA